MSRVESDEMIDPELRDELHALHRRIDALERQSERSHTLLWLLFPITLCTLALSIPTFLWIVMGIGVTLVIARLVWLYVHPAGKGPRDGGE